MPCRARMFAILTLLTATLGRSQTSQESGAGSSPAHAAVVLGEHRNVKGISNFGKVTPNLFRGAQPTTQGFEALAGMGVNIVVDARGDRTGERKEVERLGMQYVAIPWHCSFPRDDVFVQFLKLLRDNPDKKVFVHCRLGDDRTGMMIASYRMASQGWTANDAMLEMEHFGFNRAHHYVICPWLAHYEQTFPSRMETNPALRDLRSAPTPRSPDSR